MAVTFVTFANATPGTGTSFQMSISVSGTNPVLLVGVGISSVAGNVESVVSDVDGAFAEIIDVQGTLDAGTTYASAWYLAAPTAGSHTITVGVDNTFNEGVSLPYVGYVAVFSGADQATPIGANATDAANADPVTLVPGGLTADDATFGVGVCSYDSAVVTPNERYVGGGGAPDLWMRAGDATGTTGVTFNTSGGPGVLNHVYLAVRIVAGGAPNTPITIDTVAYAMTGQDVDLRQQATQTWLRVGR